MSDFFGVDTTALKSIDEIWLIQFLARLLAWLDENTIRESLATLQNHRRQLAEIQDIMLDNLAKHGVSNFVSSEVLAPSKILCEKVYNDVITWMNEMNNLYGNTVDCIDEMRENWSSTPADALQSRSDSIIKRIPTLDKIKQVRGYQTKTVFKRIKIQVQDFSDNYKYLIEGIDELLLGLEKCIIYCDQFKIYRNFYSKKEYEKMGLDGPIEKSEINEFGERELNTIRFDAKFLPKMNVAVKMLDRNLKEAIYNYVVVARDYNNIMVRGGKK